MAYSKSTDYPHELTLLSTHAKLIAHPARIKLLQQLEQGPGTLAQLAEDHPLRMVSVSNHLRALVQTGIVQVRDSNQKSIYTTRPEAWPSLIFRTIKEASRATHFSAAA